MPTAAAPCPGWIGRERRTAEGNGWAARSFPGLRVASGGRSQPPGFPGLPPPPHAAAEMAGTLPNKKPSSLSCAASSAVNSLSEKRQAQLPSARLG